MKILIYEYDDRQNYFTAQVGNKMLCFYLTKADARKYKGLLHPGVLVDFEVLDQTKTLDRQKCMRISHFNKIQKHTNRGLHTLFDVEDLKRDMIKVMWRFKYYLFIDIEMSMPSYYHSGTFQSEIIQVGYILTDKKLNVIKKNNYYIKPAFGRLVSKRTLKFLNIDREVFHKAKEYRYFYNDLKQMIDKYKPKFVVWGRNDILVLNDSYALNKKDALTAPRQFIDLLKIHKNYFNLQSDLGLFKAYETYYNTPLEEQDHDAYKDALIMMEVFKYFRSL